MTNWYFNLPLWLSTALVIVASVALSLGGHLVARAVLRRAAPRQETELAVTLMVVSAPIIGIMLAFSAVQVWEEYRQAEQAVSAEAASTSELYRGLTAYGDESRPARQALVTYVRSVVNDEWPILATERQRSPKTGAAMARLYEAIAAIEPATPRQTVIYGEAFKKLDEMAEHRRGRLLAATSTLPAIFWLVVLIGSATIVGYTVVFPATRANQLLIAGLAVSLGLIFVFILDVQDPYTGRVAVSPREMQDLLPMFERIESQ
jgi:hypothetical protein